MPLSVHAHAVVGYGEEHFISGSQRNLNKTGALLRKSVLEAVGYKLVDNDRDGYGLFAVNIQFVSVGFDGNRARSAD